jgi:hypothetical protein
LERSVALAQNCRGRDYSGISKKAREVRIFRIQALHKR